MSPPNGTHQEAGLLHRQDVASNDSNPSSIASYIAVNSVDGSTLVSRYYQSGEPTKVVSFNLRRGQ